MARALVCAEICESRCEATEYSDRVSDTCLSARPVECQRTAVHEVERRMQVARVRVVLVRVPQQVLKQETIPRHALHNIEQQAREADLARLRAPSAALLLRGHEGLPLRCGGRADGRGRAVETGEERKRGGEVGDEERVLPEEGEDGEEGSPQAKRRSWRH